MQLSHGFAVSVILKDKLLDGLKDCLSMILLVNIALELDMEMRMGFQGDLVLTLDVNIVVDWNAMLPPKPKVTHSLAIE